MPIDRYGADLQVIAPQVCLGACRAPAVQHGTRNQARRLRLGTCVPEPIGDLFVDIRTQSGGDQSGLLETRAAQGQGALHPDSALAEKSADRNHVLITDVPDGLVGTDGVQVMDMCARQARRMRPGELDMTNLFVVTQRAAPFRASAQVYGTLCQPADHTQPVQEGFPLRCHDDVRIRRQWPGVDCGHEYRMRIAVRLRHLVIGSGAKRRPQARSQQGGAYLLGCNRRRIEFREIGIAGFIVAGIIPTGIVKFYDDGLQHAPCPTVYRGDRATARGCE